MSIFLSSCVVLLAGFFVWQETSFEHFFSIPCSAFLAEFCWQDFLLRLLLTSLHCSLDWQENHDCFNHEEEEEFVILACGGIL